MDRKGRTISCTCPREETENLRQFRNAADFFGRVWHYTCWRSCFSCPTWVNLLNKSFSLCSIVAFTFPSFQNRRQTFTLLHYHIAFFAWVNAGRQEHGGLAIVNFLDEASCDRCLHRLVQMSDAGKLPGIKSIGQSYIQGFAQLLERRGQSITIYLKLFHIPLLEFMGESCYHLTINPDKNGPDGERRGMAKCPKVFFSRRIPAGAWASASAAQEFGVLHRVGIRTSWRETDHLRSSAWNICTDTMKAERSWVEHLHEKWWELHQRISLMTSILRESYFTCLPGNTLICNAKEGGQEVHDIWPVIQRHVTPELIDWAKTHLDASDDRRRTWCAQHVSFRFVSFH